jgi:hypothetical protein
VPLGLACVSETSFVQPGLEGGQDTTGGTVQRAVLVVEVAVDRADSAVAAAVGSPLGVLAGAVVTVVRTTATGSGVTDTTDGAGRVSFGSLLPGRYQVSVLRLLGAGEVAGLDSADRDVSGFGGGGFVTLEAPADTSVVAVVAGRRGSLLISEVFGGSIQVSGYGYTFATFIELYNNADTTIYLDGKLLGLGPTIIRDYSSSPNPVTCEEGAPFQLDSAGLWSQWIWRIPGSGRTYSLLPGWTAVLATDAVDHSQIDLRLPDLSGANFEFIGSTDVDNPAVPNLLTVGPRGEFAPVPGHGLLPVYAGIYYIANAVNLASLPSARIPPQGIVGLRIPRAEVLDVFASAYQPAEEATLPPQCPAWISPVFDRQPGSFFYQTTSTTIERRLFGILPNGQHLLQRTKATANDFTLSLRARPGRVP